ncbi:MAG TPA: MdtA/MuxA family multidrug efflux RND transporter periplasmic adaptor subunit [Candidatus Didemnitutus sp.]|nr:MdtA/MuxA family multidrug efflux RND transporter periplasmic adaptor subunit [Candidatus Didemnitutus sp.]
MAKAESAPAVPRRRSRWWLWVIVVVLGAALIYALFVRPFIKPTVNPRAAYENRPMPVAAEAARKADLNVRLIALGTVTPLNTVTVRSLVDGQLQKIYFTEGQIVAAGAPLADIDPRPFEVMKQQAEATLARDQSQLENARIDEARFNALLAQDSVAKQQVDTQVALVRQDEATIKVDEAQVANAALQLDYSHITAPISGRIGLRLVDLGNTIHPSDANGLAVITQLQPISVIFSVPQDTLPKLLAHYKAGETMEVDAFDRDGHTLLAKGKVVTIDNLIDPTTGTLKVRAEFANEDEALFPNQFVNVQLIADKITGAIVVPTAAIQRGTAGTFVYKVLEGNTATVQVVETGATEGGLIAVTKGLAAGDTVVTDGVDKLREGAKVELVSRSAAQAEAPAPRPRGQGKKHQN